MYGYIYINVTDSRPVAWLYKLHNQKCWTSGGFYLARISHHWPTVKYVHHTLNQCVSCDGFFVG